MGQQLTNSTKYNTEDLTAIYDLVVAEGIGLKEIGFHRHLVVRYSDVRSQGKDAYRWNEYNSGVWAKRRTRFVHSVVTLPSPKVLHEMLGLAALPLALTASLPDSIVEEIVAAMFWALDLKRPASRLYQRELKVRIDRRAPKGKGVQKPKLTQAEKIKRARELYGAGRKMTGGRSKREYLWQSKVQAAAHYYNTEWKAREAWRLKLEALGAPLAPSEIHETYSEYLRRIADKLERK